MASVAFQANGVAPPGTSGGSSSMSANQPNALDGASSSQPPAAAGAAAQAAPAATQPSQTSQQPQQQQPPGGSSATATAAPGTAAGGPAQPAPKPRDARTLELLLTAQGVTAYEARVPQLLLDFAYRHTAAVLSDALHLSADPYTSHAGARPSATSGATATAPAPGGAGGDATVSANAVQLAIASRLAFQFRGGAPPAAGPTAAAATTHTTSTTTGASASLNGGGGGGGASKDWLLALARERNKVALPRVGAAEWGARLPSERFVLSGVGWGLRDAWAPGAAGEEDEEDEEDEEAMDELGRGGGGGDDEMDEDDDGEAEGTGDGDDDDDDEGAGDGNKKGKRRPAAGEKSNNDGDVAMGGVEGDPGSSAGGKKAGADGTTDEVFADDGLEDEEMGME